MDMGLVGDFVVPVPRADSKREDGIGHWAKGVWAVG